MSTINNNYRLQLRSHKEIFATRELAVDYINTFFAPDALHSEPTLYFYGNERNPSSILAFGVGNRRVSILDCDSLKEQVEVLSQSKEEVVGISDDLQSVIKALGFRKDENRISDKVIYEPNRRNLLLADVKSVSEALEVLSQAIANATVVTFDDSDTIEVVEKTNRYTNKTDKTFNVKISGNGTEDTKTFNNNIIGVKNDGIFGSVDLEYNEDKNTLTFITSGLNDQGLFKDDAKEKVIQLATPNTSKIVHDGKTLDKVIGELVKTNDSSRLQGDESNSVITLVKEDLNGGKTVTSEVKLSQDASILVSNGGLSANIQIDVDKAQNELVLSVGSRETRVQLPGLNILRGISYNARNKSIVVEMANGSNPLVIPVGDMLATWGVSNNANSPVRLSKLTPNEAGGPETLTADVLLSPTNNLLEVVGGELLVSETRITNELIKPEVENAKTQIENKISTAVTSLEYLRGKVDENKTLIGELNEKFESIEQSVATSNIELVNTSNILKSELAKLDKTIEDVESNTNLINLVRDTANTTLVKVEELTNKVKENSSSDEAREKIFNDRFTYLTDEIGKLKVTDETAKQLLENAKQINLDQETKINQNVQEVARVKEQLATITEQIEDYEELDNKISSANSLIQDVKSKYDLVKAEVDGINASLQSIPVTIESIVETNNPIKVEVTRENNNFKVKSNIDISEHSDNIILKKNGTLFASGNSKDHSVVYKGEVKTVQDAIGSITNDISKLIFDVANASNASNASTGSNTNANNSGSTTNVTDIEIRQSQNGYQLYVNGVAKGAELSIERDTFLKSGSYDSQSKELKLSIGSKTSDNLSEVSIPVADIVVTTPNAGNGLQKDDTGYSIKVDTTSSAGVLSVSNNGLKVDLGNYATKTAVETVKNDLDAVKNSIPNNAGTGNKLITNNDLEQRIQQINNTGSTVANSDGSTLGIVKGASNDTGDIVTSNGSVSIKLAEKPSVINGTTFDNTPASNALKTLQSGGLFLDNVWDCGEY